MSVASALTEKTPLRVWVLILLIAVFFHLLLYALKPTWKSVAPPPPVEIQPIDPAKLEAIRRKWKNQESKQLLLNKDKSAPRAKDAPPDAKYFSDRNIRVEKEQRARRADVMPRQGQQQQPSLGNLGVPLPEAPRDLPRQTIQKQSRAQVAPDADQALLDKSLPEGSENLLNAQESVYYSFYARLYEAIGPIWQSRIREIPHRRGIGPGEYSTLVDVVLDREGNLLEVRRLRSSGIPELDQAVDQSWFRVRQFPNPPAGLLNDRGEVHTAWTFNVQIGNGPHLQYQPPRRVD